MSIPPGCSEGALSGTPGRRILESEDYLEVKLPSGRTSFSPQPVDTTVWPKALHWVNWGNLFIASMSNWNPYAANLFSISMNALHFHSISRPEVLPLPLSYQWHGWPSRITLSIDKILNMHIYSSTGTKPLRKETNYLKKKLHVILMNQDHHSTSSLSVPCLKPSDCLSLSSADLTVFA